MKKIIEQNNEDQIRNIYEKIKQLQSFLQIMECALDNDFEIPDIEDFRKSLYITKEFIDNLRTVTENYINYLENNNLFN